MQKQYTLSTPVESEYSMDNKEPIPNANETNNHPILMALASDSMPELDQDERGEVNKRKRISPAVIHETVREEGERELRRPPMALALSGLGAGLSMGFSLVTQSLLYAYLPANASWHPLLDNFGYCMGFLIVVLGRQQLFTENTLTPILPLLAHPSWDKLWVVLRLWALVLATNLVGAFLFATTIAHTNLFPPEIHHAFVDIAHHALRGGFSLTVLRAIFAGWLIALMVWLLPASEGSKLHVIIILTYVISLGGFAHIIAGSVDVLYLVNIGSVSWLTYFVGFMLPTLIGNIVGGVSLVAVLNFAQVASEKKNGFSK